MKRLIMGTKKGVPDTTEISVTEPNIWNKIDGLTTKQQSLTCRNHITKHS